MKQMLFWRNINSLAVQVPKYIWYEAFSMYAVTDTKLVPGTFNFGTHVPYKAESMDITAFRCVRGQILGASKSD